VILEYVGEKPYRKYDDDAGFDLYCAETVLIWPHETVEVKVSTRINIPKNCFVLIVPRSSMRRKGLVIQSIIDTGYQGPLDPFVTNTSNSHVSIRTGERFCQIILIPKEHNILRKVESFEPTERGESGKGSTGVV